MKRKIPKRPTGKSNIKERRITLKKHGTDIVEQFVISEKEKGKDRY